MRFLNKDEINALTDAFLKEIPIIMLRHISHFPRVSEGAVIAAVLSQVPGNVDAERIRELCVASLRWFVRNGDIATSGTRRYIVVPPYVIVSALDESETTLRLCGSRWRDNTVAAFADRDGAKFEELSMRLPNGTKAGIMRTIKVATNRLAGTVAYLKTIGITTITVNELRARLPYMEHLFFPPDDAYRSLPPNWGLWEQYEPQRLGSNRWESQTKWIETSNELLRWRPSEDWRGEQSARFFLHASQAKLAELGRERAILWMLLLDRKVNNSRNFWYSGNTFVAPSMLPLAYHQWLQLLSEGCVPQEPNIIYFLRTGLDEVASVLSENLGLVAIRTRPN